MEDHPVSGARFGLGISNCRQGTVVAGAVADAESLGAEIAFVSEDIGCRDAFALLTMAAARTERIRLCTGVVNPFTRSPMSLAMGAATVHEASGGRAGLGLGTSSPDLIGTQLGLPHVRPVRVMQEATETVRALLTGRTVEYDGEIFHVHGTALQGFAERSSIPVYFAAMGPQVLRLAGRIADGVLLNVGASTEYVRWAVDQIRSSAEEAGRDPTEVTIAAWHTAYIDTDRQAALRKAKRWLATMLSIPRQGELLLEKSRISTDILVPIRAHVSGYPHAGSPDEAAAHVPDEVAERLTLLGSVEVVGARLQAYRDAGVDLPVLPITALRALAPREGR
jgi:5,10-methylenetetrahydromethanopterin reductase